MKPLFTEIVRKKTVPYWEGSFTHPFLVELREGILPIEKFRYYLIQDCYYLTHFSNLYLQVANRTSNESLRKQMEENAQHLAEGELTVRAHFFKELSIDEDEIKRIEIAPTAYHYVSHMYRQLIEGNDWVVVASLLPCSWLYFDIGQTFRASESQSSIPVYQQWIETYGGPEAKETIEKECQMLNDVYRESSPEIQQQMITAFVISAKMEFSFWEMAYQLEEWVPGNIAKVEVNEK